MLVADYYTILHTDIADGVGTFRLALQPGCAVYEGHFPGEPVCPGVCNIQMLKECLETMLGRRCRLSAIRQCRLTTLVTPVQHREVEAVVRILSEEDGQLTFQAHIGKDGDVYLDLKADAVYADANPA